MNSNIFQNSNFKSFDRLRTSFQISNKFQTLNSKFQTGKASILVFLLFLFLPTQLGKHFWPGFSYLNSLKIDYFSPTIYFWDLLLIIFGAICLRAQIRFNKLVLSLGLLFLFTQAVSLIGADNVGAGLVRLYQYGVGVGFGVILASLNWTELVKKSVYWGLVGAIFLESILAILQVINGRSVGFWILGERSFSLSTLSIATFNWYGQVFLRPYATFSHPNVLAAFIVLSFFVVAWVSPKLKNLLSPTLVTQLTLGVGAIAGLLSFSRSGALVLILQMIFYLRNQWRALLVITFLTIPFLFVRFESAFNFDSLSVIRREELAGVALGQFAGNPLTGVGLNNFIVMAAGSDLIAGPTRFLQPVHNIFLLVISESGVVGLIGFLGLIGLPIYRLWRQKSREGNILLAGWAAIIFLGLFDHYFLTIGQGQRLFFLIWGLSCYTIVNETRFGYSKGS